MIRWIDTIGISSKGALRLLRDQAEHGSPA